MGRVGGNESVRKVSARKKEAKGGGANKTGHTVCIHFFI